MMYGTSPSAARAFRGDWDFEQLAGIVRKKHITTRISRLSGGRGARLETTAVPDPVWPELLRLPGRSQFDHILVALSLDIERLIQRAQQRIGLADAERSGDANGSERRIVQHDRRAAVTIEFTQCTLQVDVLESDPTRTPGVDARCIRRLDLRNTHAVVRDLFAGYQTAFIGKWHMGDATDAPRPGFDHWVSFRGQGNYFPTDGLTREQIADGRKHMFNVDGRSMEQQGYITDELTDYAMQWLEHGRDEAKPFFLYLSHKAVHSDAKPPARYADQYADLDIELPASMANTEENNRGKPMWVRNQRNSWHGADFLYHTNQPLSEYVRQYYRTLSPVDDGLGRILGYLRKNELENNTLVVFYSDNGFLFGDHGLIDKRNAYEPSVRVPMVVYAPGLLPKGAVNTARVRNLDLAPTFLDAAHVAPPANFEGKSILPIATGTAAAETWAEDFVYEYYWEWTFPHTPTTFAIQRGNLKYIQYHGVWDIEELYDLNADPGEMNNLIDDPNLLSAKVELRHRLHLALANRDGKHVVPYTERLSSGLVYRDKDGPGAAPFPPEWLEAPNDPGRMNGLFPDTPEKLEAEKSGKPYLPWMATGSKPR